MKITKYPDGTSYPEINSFKDFTFRINSYEDLWHLNQILEAYNNWGVAPNVTIPCLLDAQADRRFGPGQSHNLKLICELLNLRKAHYKVFHPHNPEVVEALINDVKIIDNSEFIKEVWLDIPASEINGKIIKNNLILMSSDAGGFKPLMKLCDKIDWQGETYSASKSRSYVDKESKLIQRIDREDFGGKDILIIDDISVYGGTFKGLSKLLRKRNCGKLYLAVSHMTVQNLGEDPVTNYFDKVFTTNSKFDEYNYFINSNGTYKATEKNLEIIKMF